MYTYVCVILHVYVCILYRSSRTYTFVFVPELPTWVAMVLGCVQGVIHLYQVTDLMSLALPTYMYMYVAECSIAMPLMVF